MSLDTTEKQQLINAHQTHGTDTGSAEVQVAMLSERIVASADTCSRTSTTSVASGPAEDDWTPQAPAQLHAQQGEQRCTDIISKLGIRG